ncbi:hypothetical protein [Ochrobactrum sp. CGA5]|uniref:hypothetical protein n=1 Tax=Ochrobactrum sp. CGA5 TaxID=2583453 RepID=UPI001120F917|nr:hypothetical protein [Ochrobactrum sp. CGA5]
MTVLLLVYILVNSMFSVIISGANLDDSKITSAGDNTDTGSGQINLPMVGDVPSASAAVNDDTKLAKQAPTASENGKESDIDNTGVLSSDDEQLRKSIENIVQNKINKESQKNGIVESQSDSNVSTTSSAVDPGSQEGHVAQGADGTNAGGSSTGQRGESLTLQAQKKLYDHSAGDLEIKFQPQQESYSEAEKQTILSWIKKNQGQNGYYEVGIFVHEIEGTSASSLLTQQASLYYQLLVFFKSQGEDLSRVHLRNAVPSDDVENVVKARYIPCEGACSFKAD